MLRLCSIRFLLATISFLFIVVPSEAAEEIDREAIRTQLGVELKNFHKEAATQTLIWLSPAPCGLGKGTKLVQFSHMDLIEKADALRQSLEDQELTLEAFQAQNRVIQGLLTNPNRKYKNAREVKKILKSWKHKNTYEFQATVTQREKDIERDKSILQAVKKETLKVEERTKNKITFLTFKKYIETSNPSLMEPTLKAITLEEMRSLFE